MSSSFHGPELHHEGGEHHASSGFVADLKAHKLEVIIGGTALLLTIMLYLRSKSSSTQIAPAPTTATGTGNLTGTGSTVGSGSSSSTDALASAIAGLSQSQQTSSQSIQAELAALTQKIGNSVSSSNGAGSVANPGVIPSGSNNPGSGLGGIQTNAGGFGSALQARNKIGDNAIVSYFSQFGLPSWVGLQYVAQNYATLPANAASLNSISLDSLNNWLNTNGYRNASSGTFTPLVSSSTVPANVQSQLTAAYGG